jgi:hypothetical protein
MQYLLPLNRFRLVKFSSYFGSEHDPELVECVLIIRIAEAACSPLIVYRRWRRFIRTVNLLEQTRDRVVAIIRSLTIMRDRGPTSSRRSGHRVHCDDRVGVDDRRVPVSDEARPTWYTIPDRSGKTTPTARSFRPLGCPRRGLFVQPRHPRPDRPAGSIAREYGSIHGACCSTAGFEPRIAGEPAVRRL